MFLVECASSACTINLAPKMLHEALSNEPEFFIEMLKHVYQPKEDMLWIGAERRGDEKRAGIVRQNASMPIESKHLSR